MVDFVRLRLTAQRLIEANGRLVTFRGDPLTAANPSAPERGPDFSSGTSETAIVVFVPASGSGLGQIIVELGGTLLKGFDQIGLVADLSLTNPISTYNRIQDLSTVWKLEKVDTLQPEDDPLIHQLGLNR